MGTKSRPLRMQSAVEELGVQVKDEDKVWSLIMGPRGENKLLSPWGIWKVDVQLISKAWEAFAR